MDYKLVFSAIGLIFSLVSLGLSLSAKKEARETKMLELAHQKRMLLSTHLSEVNYITSILKDVSFGNQKFTSSFEHLIEFRNQLIEELNKSAELTLDIKKLDKKQLLNEISDFNTMMAVYKGDIHRLKNYIDKSS